MNSDEARRAYRHPRYPEFTALLKAKAMMLGVDIKNGIGWASHTFVMGHVGNLPTSNDRVDATTLEPLPHREWDQRVNQNYGAGVFLQWLEANPVTTEGNSDG